MGAFVGCAGAGGWRETTRVSQQELQAAALPTAVCTGHREAPPALSTSYGDPGYIPPHSEAGVISSGEGSEASGSSSAHVEAEPALMSEEQALSLPLVLPRQHCPFLLPSHSPQGQAYTACAPRM